MKFFGHVASGILGGLEGQRSDADISETPSFLELGIGPQDCGFRSKNETVMREGVTEDASVIVRPAGLVSVFAHSVIPEFAEALAEPLPELLKIGIVERVVFWEVSIVVSQRDERRIFV